MTETSGDAMFGSVLGGRYEIVGRVSHGGTSVVYRARDLRLGRTVALKVVRDDFTSDPDYAKRFDREARAAAILSHPNIVAIFDQGHEGDRSYIVMEYIRGQSLRSIIAESAPLPPALALTYIDAVAKALAAAHEAGIVHRDIKPENVLITADGQVKVTDFGLAKNLSAQTTTATSDHVMGTISYIPPEIPQTGVASMASDIYSAGVMLYEMLTGLKPHRGDDISEILYKHVNNDIPPPSQALTGEARARIPDYLDALVQACTARQPSARPANGRIFVADLQLVRQRLDQGITHDPALAQRFLSAPDQSGGDADDVTVTLPAASPAGGPIPATAQEVAPVNSGSASAELSPGPHATPLTKAADKKPARAPKRQRVWVVPVSLLAVVLVVGSVVLWWIFQGQWVTTPPLVGLTADQATAALVDTGLTMQTSNEYSEDVAAGFIIRTDPAPGDRIKRHGVIQAWVSLGPERYTMPAVVGLTQDEAEAALLDTHLAVGTVTEVYSETVDQGLVVAASQDEGTPLKRDTPVDLSVSKGREPIPITSYVCQPPYQDCPAQADAQSALEMAGFQVAITEDNDRNVPAGAVISQDPSTGTGWRNDTVNLVISLGPKMISVPDVRGKSRAEAISIIAGAGFAYRTENANATGNPLGFATKTDPAAGSTAPEGSTVTIYLV